MTNSVMNEDLPVTEDEYYIVLAVYPASLYGCDDLMDPGSDLPVTVAVTEVECYVARAAYPAILVYCAPPAHACIVEILQTHAPTGFQAPCHCGSLPAVYGLACSSCGECHAMTFWGVRREKNERVKGNPAKR